ncbi:unnamed protein product [Mytilus coruscus]|uniref:Uncharacterized protein n=1 Tax=Mytilus coruscus TaxID=42192 RepID=A0A6J8ELP4_MYTCO|nr:unnamed protein product [Mytilus coruscus]
MDSEGPFLKPENIRIRYRDLGDDDSNSYFLASTKLRPYVGEEIYVDPKKYSKVDSNDVDDDLLNKFIERVLLSLAMKEAGEDDFGDSKSENEPGISPSKRRATNISKERSLKQRRQDKKNKKGRKTEKREEEVSCEAVPEVNNVTQSIERNITLPLGEFRKMVNAEIESRAARIHVYYQKQWDHLQQDRMAAYRSCILWKEDCNKAEYMYLKVETELNKLQTAYDSLQTEMTSIKDAKRKRRSAAKTRRSNKDRTNNDNDENIPYFEPNSV